MHEFKKTREEWRHQIVYAIRISGVQPHLIHFPLLYFPFFCIYEQQSRIIETYHKQEKILALILFNVAKNIF